MLGFNGVNSPQRHFSNLWVITKDWDLALRHGPFGVGRGQILTCLPL